MNFIPEGSRQNTDKYEDCLRLWDSDPVLSQMDCADFPTSREIVAKGMIDLIEFKKRFRLSNVYIDKLAEVILGISPEQGCVVGSVLSALCLPQQIKLIDFLDQRGYLVITDGNEKCKKKLLRRIQQQFIGRLIICSVINLKAAQRVIQHDRQRGDDTFPSNIDVENLESIKNWLINHRDEWIIGSGDPIVGQRLGLLSGYPHRSVHKFDHYHQEANELFHILSGLNIDFDALRVFFKRGGGREELEAVQKMKAQRDIIPDDVWQRIEEFEQFITDNGEFIACDKEDDEWRKKVCSIQQRVYKLIGLGHEK